MSSAGPRVEEVVLEKGETGLHTVLVQQQQSHIKLVLKSWSSILKLKGHPKLTNWVANQCFWKNISTECFEGSLHGITLRDWHKNYDIDE